MNMLTHLLRSKGKLNMKKKPCKNFIEYIDKQKAISADNDKAVKGWVDSGRYYPRMLPDAIFEWSEEVHKAKYNHGEFIKLVGDKFEKGEVSVSKFTVLLFEYFSINQPVQPEYQEIKDKWGSLIDFNLLDTKERV